MTLKDHYYYFKKNIKKMNEFKNNKQKKKKQKKKKQLKSEGKNVFLYFIMYFSFYQNKS